MKFVYGGDDPGLREAVDFVNELAFMEGFWQAIAEHSAFTYTDLSSGDIASRMRAVEREIQVQHYYRNNTAVAATKRSYPFTVFYNTKYKENSPARKSNTLVHEFVHNVDWFGDGTATLEYTHPRRHTSTRPQSAPYAIGSLAQEWWILAHQHEGRELDQEEKAEAEAFDCDLDELDDDEISWVTPT